MAPQEDDPFSRVLYELCSIIIHILRCPPPLSFPYPSSNNYTASFQISPVSFASLFFGVSLAMMMFGSVIFLIGFVLMPWIVGMVLFFYFAGFVFNLSHLGRSFLCWALPTQHSPAWKY